MAPPFRTDHIGSLLRPSDLLDAQGNPWAQPPVVPDEEKLKKIEKQATADVVSKQLELSVRPITSGEYSRRLYSEGFFEKLEGFTSEPKLQIPDAFRTDFPTTNVLKKMGINHKAAFVCTAPIRWKSSVYLEEWELMTAALSPEQRKLCKITIPAPSHQHIMLKLGTAYTKESGYQTDREYFEDLGKAYTAEIKALYDAGCRQISVDDPHMTYFCSEEFLGGCKADGTDAEALLDLYLESHNMFVRERPGKDLHMGMHLCRGNMRSGHFVTGSYDKIASKLFEKTDYDTYYLEFHDLEHTGGFDVLQFLPKGNKNVVLGLVSTKTPDLEDSETLQRSINEAAEWIAKGQGVSKEEALDCLALSPQCGFSSASRTAGVGMTMERMWEKLELIRDTARKVWKDAP